MQVTLDTLVSWHYNDIHINDTYSKRVYTSFIDILDPTKQFFTRQDLQHLSHHRYAIDDHLLATEMLFFEDTLALYKKQMSYVRSFYTEFLRDPITFDSKGSLELDHKKRRFSWDNEALKSRWGKSIKYQVMSTMFQLYESDLSTEDAKALLPKTFPFSVALEQQARDKVRLTLELRFKRLSDKLRQNSYNKFLRVLTTSTDPHTSFYPPQEKEDFDIEITGRLEGIGASLQEEDGYVKIVRVIPGSAAWRQKGLAAEDLILKVGEGEGDPIDIVGGSVRDAVKLIRGKKGTLVKLTVKKPSGKIVVVPILRDVVIIDETYAKAAIISPPSTSRRFGYIYLPGFYGDYSNSSARHSSTDVALLLKKLSSESVDGVILDVRNNGGGYLDDAIKMSGLFISKGPIVQVQTKSKRIDVRHDINPSISYDGPLVVLTNWFSASASEILAGALQDYGRAIIIGSPSTFGKGTVQTFLNLDRHVSYSSFKPMGSLKLTIQTFYRINGNSTQFRGVEPDIIIPSSYDYLDLGERTLSYPLPWTRISSVKYAKWPVQVPLHKIKQQSYKRIQSNPHMSKIKAYTQLLKSSTSTPQPLALSQAWSQVTKLDTFAKGLDDISTSLSAAPIDYIRISRAPLKDYEQESSKKWLDSIRKDLYIEESLAVLTDLIPYYEQ